MLVTAILLIIFIIAAVLIKPHYEKRVSKDAVLIVGTIVLMALLFALDRTSKVEIPVFLEGKETFELIPGIIQLRNLPGGNTGAAWGMFSENTWILVGFSSVVVVAAFYLMFVKKFYSFWVHVSAALVTAGGIGNLYDRIVHGSVTDFLEFQFIKFPIFNIADCCISAGAALLIAAVIFSKKDEPLFVTKNVKENIDRQEPGNEADASE